MSRIIWQCRHTRRNFSWRFASLIALALVSTIVLVPGAQAQESGVTAISAFGGYYIASDIYNEAASNKSLGLNDSFEYGGRLAHFPNNRLGIEFGYARTGSDLQLNSATPIANPGAPLGRLDLDEWDLNFLFSQPTYGKTVPYFTMGLGWTTTRPDVSVPTSSKSLFAFNFGIGTFIKTNNEKLAMRLDARWRVTDLPFNTSSEVYCDPWGCWSYSSSWYNSGELTAGLTYRLGQ